MLDRKLGFYTRQKGCIREEGWMDDLCVVYYRMGDRDYGQGCHCCILLEQHLLPRHYNWGSSHNIAHRLATKNSAFVVIFLGEQNFSGWRVSAKIMRFERYTVISVSRDYYFRSLTVTTTLTMTLSRSTSSRSSRKSGERIHKN